WPRTLGSRRPPSTTHRWLPISPRGAHRPWPARPPRRRGGCRCGPCPGSGLPRCGARSRCVAGAGRCRHSCCCCTGVSFCRLRVGLAIPSVLRTPGPGRREDSRWLFDLGWAAVATFLAVTDLLLVLGVRTRALNRCPSHGSCAALLHYIKTHLTCYLRR